MPWVHDDFNASVYYEDLSDFKGKGLTAFDKFIVGTVIVTVLSMIGAVVLWLF